MDVPLLYAVHLSKRHAFWLCIQTYRKEHSEASLPVKGTEPENNDWTIFELAALLSSAIG